MRTFLLSKERIKHILQCKNFRPLASVADNGIYFQNIGIFVLAGFYALKTNENACKFRNDIYHLCTDISFSCSDYNSYVIRQLVLFFTGTQGKERRRKLVISG